MSDESNKEFTPIPSFYFKVELDNEEISFQEVSGLEANLEVESVVEGGNNLFSHRLPVRQTYNNITLNKAVVEEEDDFYQWIRDSLLLQENIVNSSFGERVKTIGIHLMSPKSAEEIRSWYIVDAYPIKWSISNLDASESKIAIDSVDLVFQYLTNESPSK